MTDDRPRSPWAFVACLVVLAASAAGLVLLIPASLLDGDVSPLLMTALGALVIAAGVAARRLRPSTSR